MMPSSGAAGPCSDTFTILLVDDEPAVLRLLRFLLVSNGYSCLEARGAEEALRLARARATPVDLALIDLDLPSGAARELAGRLREALPGISVLFMVSVPTPAPEVAAGNEGEIVPKPLSAGILLNAVRKALKDTDSGS